MNPELRRSISDIQKAVGNVKRNAFRLALAGGVTAASVGIAAGGVRPSGIDPSSQNDNGQNHSLFIRQNTTQEPFTGHTLRKNVPTIANAAHLSRDAVPVEAPEESYDTTVEAISSDSPDQIPLSVEAAMVEGLNAKPKTKKTKPQQSPSRRVKNAVVGVNFPDTPPVHQVKEANIRYYHEGRATTPDGKVHINPYPSTESLIRIITNNRIAVDFEILGVVTSSQEAPLTCDFDEITQIASQAAKDNGIDLSSYTGKNKGIMFFVAKPKNCPFEGDTEMGDPQAQALGTAVIYSSAQNDPKTVGHELSHQLGGRHNGELVCKKTIDLNPDNPACNRLEGEDSGNILGYARYISGYPGHTTGYQESLGLRAPVEFLRVIRPGVYEIGARGGENDGKKYRALVLELPNTNAKNHGNWLLYIEDRRNTVNGADRYTNDGGVNAVFAETDQQGNVKPHEDTWRAASDKQKGDRVRINRNLSISVIDRDKKGSRIKVWLRNAQTKLRNTLNDLLTLQ